MRATALIALLPFLATVATARPHQPGHDHSAHRQHRIRKSLNFGPNLEHASFEVLDHSVTKRDLVDQAVDSKEVAKRFIEEKLSGREGEAFYIREDTYTDSRTGITHVYARQLLNGLEVGDGDLNLNIDRNGRVLSWGNSFHPGPAPNFDLQLSASGATAEFCSVLQETYDAHHSELARAKGDDGPWGLVKSAAQVILGGLKTEKPEVNKHEVTKLHKSMRHIKHHLNALCGEEAGSHSIAHFHSPEEALVKLIDRISPISKGMREHFSTADLIITPHHTLAPKAAPAEPPIQMISGAGLVKSGVVEDVPARLMYTQTSTGEPRMVWKMEVQMKDSWYEAYVDVATGELLRIVDWANDYSWGTSQSVGDVQAQKGGKQKHLPSPPTKLEPYTYEVFPWGINDPLMGNRSLLTKPWDDIASPMGWHQFPTASNGWSSTIPGQNVTGNMTTFYTTAGNNVIAHEDWEGQNNYLLNYRPVNESMVFAYEYGEPDGLAPKEYVDFVVTQLFYINNMYHDLLYRLGFDEAAGNFQMSNFNKTGRGGDPVVANAQDGSGYNNANFMTPPDGQSGRMRMYLWDTATPFRDGDLEAGIIIHEYSHGLSTRLTGGPMNSGCLGFGEAGGMGEGWGDAIGTLIRQVLEHKSFVNGTDLYTMGSWAANQELGIRNYKYSTNTTVNPSTYKILNKPAYWGVHAIGEVWAEFLFIMSSRLIEKYGFSNTLFPPTNTSVENDYYTKVAEESVDSLGRPLPLVPKHGNTLSVQLIIDAMKLQPCRPSFFDARDAIIQADEVLTGGANGCLIWRAFAERGLGAGAKIVGQTPGGWGGIRTDGFDIPAKVCKGSERQRIW